MRRFLPNLNALKAFEAAGRHNSFSGAGDELNLTHSAISRHVRGLEKQLGAELFRTVPKGVELTAIGQKYLTIVTSALDEISVVSVQLKTGKSPPISVTCEPVFAAKWLMRHISEFRSSHPDIAIVLVSSGDVIDLRTGAFDFAIRYCTRDYVSTSQDPLFEEDVYPYGAPVINKIRGPKDLQQKTLLHEDDGTLWQKWCETAGYGPTPLPATTSALPAVLAFEEAIASDGIFLTSPRLAENDVKAARLRKLSDHGIAYGSYRLLYNDQAKLSPEAKIFRAWLIERAKKG
ncbi:LysR substrate-binding domain-containing protein [Rhodophyticola sp.]|jgi:DNA-binding transcriptional LysR family regulator|uniref:LysR substrate-binding domain-containing protein n=1 Tax=Rhodophyticola sp. TaxID=2680032 RepID=UPI003D2C5A26